MPTVCWRIHCERRRGLDITSLHSWFEGLVVQPEPIVLEHGPMVWEGMPTEADITLTHQQGRGDKAKRTLVLRKKKLIEMKKQALKCMWLLAIIWYRKHCSTYSDCTEAYPLTTADQSNTVSSGADPGSDPPLCNPSAEHQRLASDQGVQWPGRELPDTPVTVITQTVAHTQLWSVSLVSKLGKRLSGHSHRTNQNMLVEFTHDLFLTCIFPHFCCKLFY